jgi:hypothetical protein
LKPSGHVPNHAGDLSRATGHLRAAVAKRRGRPPAAPFLLFVLARYIEPTTRSLPPRPTGSWSVRRGAVVVCGVNKVRHAQSGTLFCSVGIEMVDLYPVTTPTTARKEAARMAREAYDKRVASKTKADQVVAIRVKAATDAESNAGRGKCASWPGSFGGDFRNPRCDAQSLSVRGGPYGGVRANTRTKRASRGGRGGQGTYGGEAPF